MTKAIKEYSNDQLCACAEHKAGTFPEIQEIFRNAMGEALQIMEAHEATFALTRTANKLTWAADSLRDEAANYLHDQQMKRKETVEDGGEVNMLQIKRKDGHIRDVMQNLSIFNAMFQGLREAHDSYNGQYQTIEQKKEIKRFESKQATKAIAAEVDEFESFMTGVSSKGAHKLEAAE